MTINDSSTSAIVNCHLSLRLLICWSTMMEYLPLSKMSDLVQQGELVVAALVGLNFQANQAISHQPHEATQKQPPFLVCYLQS